MVKSIRFRLQLWYALVLIVVVGFAAIMYERERSVKFGVIDSRIESAALYIDSVLRSVPPHEVDDDVPGFPQPDWDDYRKEPFPPPKKGGKDGGPPRRPREEGPSDGEKGGGPFRRTREEALNTIAVPPEMLRDAVRPYFAVWRHDGRVLKSRELQADRTRPELSSNEAVRPQLATHADGREAIMRGPWRTTILVGQSTAQAKSELAAFAWQLAAAGGIVLAVGLLGGWWISSRIFRPIASMSATASRISVTSMSDRIDTRHVDKELADLARVLNATFDRLQDSFERQARFTADASHELRTPLAIIQTHAQLALDRPRSAEEYRQTVESCLRAANRMKTIVEGLLNLARADANRLVSQQQPIELKKLVNEAVVLFHPLAEAKRLTITAELANVRTMGDPAALMQVVMNLLNNAINYNRENGSITVRLVKSDDDVTLTVSDTGCGIPEQDKPHIFERFYRVDKARSRASGGTGLGLAICKAIVEAHGGEIGVDTEVDEGSSFWVRLPRPE